MSLQRVDLVMESAEWEKDEDEKDEKDDTFQTDDHGQEIAENEERKLMQESADRVDRFAKARAVHLHVFTLLFLGA